jgi:hypothetical protein
VRFVAGESLEGEDPMKKCALLRSDGSDCDVPPSFRLKRVDGTTFDACTRHWHLLEKLMAKHPDYYSPLEVGTAR